MMTACAVDDPDVSGSTTELAHRAPVLIQPGAGQILLAVSDDNYAVYQEGQTVFATKLAPGAERTLVASVPTTNLAQVLQVGKVVFVWSDPQRNLPGFGVSPLIVWTAQHGAQLASTQSAVGLVATAASSDNRQIVFTTNVTDDGLRGDLVHAHTRDALHPDTLLADIPLGFPSTPCRPLANFASDHGREVPVAAYCAGSDTTATLSKWDRGTKIDLVANIATPMPFVLESNADASTFLVDLANASVATVTIGGRVTIVDPAASSRQGFVGRHDTVGYATAGQLRVARRGQAPEAISAVTAIYRNTYNRAGYSAPRTVSADSLVLFGSIADPATGLTDMNLLDLRTGDTTPLETAADATVFSEIFTTDGSHGLFFRVSDPTSFVATLVAGDRDGTHLIGDGVWDVLAAADSDVTFTTDPIVDFSTTQTFFQSTGDLFVADAACPSAEPRLIATQANLFYLASHDRRKLVFPSASEPGGPGLYLAGTR
ncbi:MAG: hypothetical protein ABI867_30905 [Kofleriaceae bacterium]